MYGGNDKTSGEIVGVSSAIPECEFQDISCFSSIEETLMSKSITEEGKMLDVLLVAGLNPKTGEIQWTKELKSGEIFQKIISKSQMSSMLRDKTRNEQYEKAISSTIAYFQQTYKQSPIVLDIGTGTGLLAMMAARHGAEQVVACEMFEPLCNIANQIAKQNNFKNIKFFPHKSTKLDMNPKADILVSEIVDSILLGEGILPTIQHAKQHLLKQDCFIVPHSAVLFAQLIECASIKSMLDLSEVKIGSSNFFWRSEESAFCRTNGGCFPVHALKCSYEALSDPFPIFSFQFSKTISKSPLDQYNLSPESFNGAIYQEIMVNGIRSGDCHAVLVWWEMHLTEENYLSTKPNQNSEWQDHWLQIIFPLPNDVKIESNEVVNVHAAHDDYNLWFNLTKREKFEGNPPKKSRKNALQLSEKPYCFCGTHMLYNYERTWMLADTERTDKYNQALTSIIEKHGKDLVCLDISDGSLCALIASALGVKKVLSIDSQAMSELLFAQIASFNSIDLEIFNVCLEEVFDELELTKEKIDILVAEPFFQQMQNWTLLQSLSFWYRRTYLSGLLSDNCIFLPRMAKVLCVAAEFSNLYNSHGKVMKVNEFDHSVFDQFEEKWHEELFMYPLWQYDFKELSKPLELMLFDYGKEVNTINSTHNIIFESKGTCHGIIFWIDYQLTESIWVSTSPKASPYCKSTVQFLETPIPAFCENRIEIHSSLNHHTAEFSFKINNCETHQ